MFSFSSTDTSVKAWNVSKAVKVNTICPLQWEMPPLKVPRAPPFIASGDVAGGGESDLKAPSTASWLLMAAGLAVLFEVSQLGIWDGWAMQISTIFCNSAFLTAKAVISTVMLKASQLPLL